MKNDLKDALALLKKIKFSKDYNKFYFLENINRITDSKHVQKMVASIRSMGVIRPVICVKVKFIDGTERMYVIDGQHLFKALCAEELEIPYIIIDVDGDIDLVNKMAMLNNSSKSWDLMNYINAWKMIRPDYMKLFKWKNMYDIEVSMLACIATNMPSIRFGTQPIKNGTFQINNPKAEDMCKAFNDIFLKIGMADRGVKFQFLNAFMQAYNPSYSHSKVMAAIDKHMKTVKLMSSGDETGAYIRKQIFKLPK